MRAKAVLSWSSGKDSALAWHRVRESGEMEVVGALTTVAASRVAMHGVPEALLDAQAKQLGLPLTKIRIPFPCPNSEYEARTGEALRAWKSQGVSRVIFGDLYLKDIRDYRRKSLAALGLMPVFPVWGEDTARLAREMIAAGIKAVLTCVDPKRLPADFVGREFDESLLLALPPEVDPCGENGEFHTFVHTAPFFEHPIVVKTGARFRDAGFEYVHLTH